MPELRFPEFVDDWTTKKISDILEIKHGKDYKSESAKYGTYPVIGTGGVITYIDSFLCDWDCVCIGRKGTINKPIYMDEPFWSVDTLFYTKPLCGVSKFQYYLFERINWLSYNEASGVPSLSASTIKRIEVSMPSFDEQNKIVQFLSLIDKKIDKQQQLIDTLKLYKRGALQQIFSNNHNCKPLKEITSYVSSSLALSSLKDEPLGAYPVYDASGISQYIDSFQIENKYIAIIKDGSGVGKLQLCKSQSSVIGTLGAIVSKELPIEYIYAFMQTIDFKQFVTGMAIPHIYYKDYSEIKVPIPDIATINKIVNIFNSIDLTIIAEENKYNYMMDLKQGLLQKMFI